jgi:hypothetical protein
MGAAGFGIAAGASLAGGIWGALAADSAGAYNASMAEFDAKQLDDMAKDAIARGEEEVSRVGEQGRRVLGEQRASIAGQGIELGVGTMADLQMETMAAVDDDAKTVRLNAAREALGLLTNANSTRAQGRMAKKAAKGQAVGTLLTGGAQALAYGAQAAESA